MALLVIVAAGRVDCALGNQLAAVYTARWAGLPAARIRVGLNETGADYRSDIGIETEGVPRWFTHFRAVASGEGHFAGETQAKPSEYDAYFDLHKRHDRRISVHFADDDAGFLADRGAADTSRKPQLDAVFRRNVIDPLSAMAALRRHLAAHHPVPGDSFVIPVYDGARRFDARAEGRSPGGDNLIRLRLTLTPIAGFKGESSDDGDPDSAPRPVDVAFTNDAQLLPVSLQVSIAYLPLTVRFDHLCPSFDRCEEAPGR